MTLIGPVTETDHIQNCTEARSVIILKYVKLIMFIWKPTYKFL